MSDSKCLIKSCGNTSIKRDLFMSPNDPELLKKWQEAAQTNENNFFLCENHFNRDDLLIEKILSDDAVPRLHLTQEEDIQLEGDCCGVCLKEIGRNVMQMDVTCRTIFKEISGYNVLTEFLCHSCSNGLYKYKYFRSEVAKKHAEIYDALSKQKAVIDDDSDDCMIVEDIKPQTPTIVQPQISNIAPKPEDPVTLKKISPTNQNESFSSFSSSLLYECQFCTNFPILPFDKLVTHTRNYHSYRCEYCRKVFANSDLLNSHILTDHDSRNVFLCKKCGMEGFLDRFVLEDHYESNHSKNLFKCKEATCELFFNTSANLRAHMVLTHPSKIVVAENLGVLKVKSNTKKASIKSKFTRVTPPSKIIKINPKFSLNNAQSKSSQLSRALTKSIKPNRDKFVIKMMSEKINEGNVAPIRAIKEEKMDFEDENETNTVSVEEVTIVESATIKMESEDQEEIESVESCSEKEFEKEAVADEEMPIPWLDQDLNLPSTFVSSINENSTDIPTAAAAEKEDLDDIIQSKKTIIQLEMTKKNKKGLLDEPKSNDSNLVRCLDCGSSSEMMTVQELLHHRYLQHGGHEESIKYYEPIPRLPTPPPLRKFKLQQKERKSKFKNNGLMKVACEFCFFECFEKHLQRHIDSQHADQNGNPNFLCHICSKGLYTLSGFNRHYATHDQSMMFVCDICNWMSSRKCDLTMHIRKRHLHLYPKKKYTCGICQKKLFKSKVNPHMTRYHKNNYDCGARANSETNFYDCHQCGASYIDLYTYRKHDCEKGRFQIRCPECSIPIANAESLQKHRANNCRTSFTYKGKEILYRRHNR